MSVKDVIKKSVYANLAGSSGGLSFETMLFILVLASFIGIYIFVVYRTTGKAAFYSRDLNVTLAGMSVIVAAIMIAMQSSLIVSLGMVGALSIVRFRNAVKNPMDLLYLFWSVSAGIICGVGLYILAVTLCFIMTLLILILEKAPNIKASSLLIIRAHSAEFDWEYISDVIDKHSKYWKEKSRSIKNGETEVIIELKAREEALINELEEIEGIHQINFLAHDGEFRI